MAHLIVKVAATALGLAGCKLSIEENYFSVRARTPNLR
jgi:hypothetical protein